MAADALYGGMASSLISSLAYARLGLLAACVTCGTSTARADMVAMRDYNLLSRGMSEAEVLYRLGPYDHESRYTDYDHNIVRKVWYYIPARATSNSWITEIEFDQRGVVQSLVRYRARR